MAEKPGDVLNIDELASYLKIPRSTLYKIVREGKVPSQKVGRHWRFHKKAIDQWLGNGITSGQVGLIGRPLKK
jgi:excisionase family DNA binding protein